MTPTPTPTPTTRDTADTVVIGAGLAGLVAATTAARQGASVVLLDRQRPGGRARCDQRVGFTLNRGPRALYVGGAADRALQALGVDTGRGGPPPMAGAAGRIHGRLELLPQGPATAVRTRLLGLAEKAAFARAFSRLQRTDAAALAGTSVAAWLDQQGLSGAARHLTEALVRVNTYTDAPELLDAGAALAGTQAGLSTGVRYLDGGWQVLVDALVSAAEAAGVTFRRSAATGVGPLTPDGRREVRTSDGEVRATSVVVAVGTPDAAATLLGYRPTSWSGLGPPVTAACLELGIRGLPDRQFVLGIDEPTYLSTHAPAARLAPDGHAVVHLLRYQQPGEDRPADEQRRILEDLAGQAGVAADAVVTSRFLARMVVSGGLPLASAGGLTGRPTVAVADQPGVSIAGDWVGPTGLLLDAAASSGAAAGVLAAERSTTMVGA